LLGGDLKVKVYNGTEAGVEIPSGFLEFYTHIWPTGIAAIAGKTASDTLPDLRAGMSMLGHTEHQGEFYIINPGAILFERLHTLLYKCLSHDLEAPENRGLVQQALAEGVIVPAPGKYKPCAQNAGACLEDLARLAREHPNGVWRVCVDG